MTAKTCNITPARPQHVLIIKPSALGDVVTAMPVLRGLRRTFGREVRIAWLIDEAYRLLIEQDGDLDEAIIFDRRHLARAWRSPAAAGAVLRLRKTLRNGGFDWVIDLQGLLRSGLLTAATKAPLRVGFADAREGASVFYTHRVEAHSRHTVDRNIELARSLGIDAGEQDMTLQVTDAGRRFAEQLTRQHGLRSGDFIVCSVPTRWATKQYPVRHWRAVAAELAKEVPVVLSGSPAQAERLLCDAVAEGLGSGVINLGGRTDIQQMVGLIAASAGVICCDSAAKFIAPAVGVDSITLIGPTRPEHTGPYLLGRAIIADVPCRGCLKRRCRHITCMQLIKPADVIAAAKESLLQREKT
ncbi:MAG: glycosyltransferase family 9 protein [Planctomycetota bacterium]|nr:glycosyltransferase family 9 protein [Planctomycetota bacterium]